jgi:hypothetical protein
MSEVMSIDNGDNMPSATNGIGPKHGALTVVVIGLGQMGRKCLLQIDIKVTVAFHYSDERLCKLIGCQTAMR